MVALNDAPGCVICGRPFDGPRCPTCGSRWRAPTSHRQLTLIVLLIVLAAGAFIVTRSVAGRAHELRQVDGQLHFEQARAALDSGQAGSAIVHYRRAVATDPENRLYRLALARALIAGGENDEARQILEGLRAESPDDVDAILELARLEASADRWSEALRHYQHTLATLWSADQEAERRQVRIELIRRLLARGDRRRALSELLIWSATLPDDPDTQAAAGRMYLEAGDPDRAQEHFEAALAADPAHPDALAGSGEAAFAREDYTRAQRLLALAPDTSPRVAELRELTSLVLDSDPLTPRLALAERRRRITAIVDHVVPAVEQCLATSPVTGETLRQEMAAALEALEALEGTRDSTGRMRLASDDVTEALAAAYRGQAAAVQACGANVPMDRAVLLIGSRHDIE